MQNSDEAELHEITTNYCNQYQKKLNILSFQEFLWQVRQHPNQFLRNSVSYLSDTFDYFSKEKIKTSTDLALERFKLFDMTTEHSGPIVGGEQFQNDFYKILQRFKHRGHAAKLVLLHGPNGSSKSSSVDAIAKALEVYSSSDEGAVYRFNWIFPSDKDSIVNRTTGSQPIGFGKTPNGKPQQSFAHLSDIRIASRITSEYKENPIYLLPSEERENILTRWIAEATNTPKENVKIPDHIKKYGLSKQNQLIFEALLNAYDGDLARVYNHVQVERFYFSKQYRVGISCVEPQMSIDAREQQLTVDKNYAHIPAILQNISFYKTGGELIEANRGVLEFSDLLKRPLDAFKYLLSTIERSQIGLPSGTANLDLIFMATTNEKHLDAFKTMPDFSSFKGRIELLKVPYLLKTSDEIKIYLRDISAIEHTKKIAPHTLYFLCKWAILTRLKQPDPKNYTEKQTALLQRMKPELKERFYDQKSLAPEFSLQEIADLEEIRYNIMTESRDTAVYEGRFGASPREIKSLLHRAAQNSQSNTVTVLDIIREIKLLIKDKTVYEFLQFEPRNHYHDVEYFISIIENSFNEVFDKDLAESMEFADEKEYENLLIKYVNHVVASIKKEKILDQVTNNYEKPSEKIMTSVEEILSIKLSKEDHRASILSKIASHKLDHPEKELSIPIILKDYLENIKAHFFKERINLITENMKMLIEFGQDKRQNLSENDIDLGERCYKNMATKNYTKEAVIIYLKHRLGSFMIEKDLKKDNTLI